MNLLRCVILTGLGLVVGYAPRPIDVIKVSQPKVVEISIRQKHGGFIGSGAYVSSDGLVLTCAHLFSHGDGEIQVKMPSGAESTAVLVRLDTKNDLAIIKTFPMHKVPYFTLGLDPNIGDSVIAFGSPLSFTGTVTQGYISNVHLGKWEFTLHSAAINPGNSGGPLVNSHGELVGVNVSTWMMNAVAPAESLANAVSLNAIRQILKD